MELNNPWGHVSGRWVLCVLLATLLAGSACVPRRDRRAPPPPPAVPAVDVDAADAPPPAEDPAPQPRALPTLEGEPGIRVLVDRGALLSLRLLNPGRTDDGVVIAPGAQAVRPSGDDAIALTGARRPLPGPQVVIRFRGAGPHFRAGPGGRSFAGDLVVVRTGNAVAIVEEVGVEAYLLGVIAKEVEPDWPLEALKAQAVAARSYATAQWMRRHERPWQLDASELVDMAYAGHVAEPHVRLATAVTQTRGDLLLVAGQPLPAFFHAASGGFTSDIAHVWPHRRLPDGVTLLTDAMPPGPDPWAAHGARIAPERLGAWRYRITYAELERRLRARDLDCGRVERVRIAERTPTGGRVTRVVITGSSATRTISAHALRMACGSTELKSTLWTDFRYSATALVIEGRGYGHGVGLPQASAWAMASAGKRATQILQRYYPGAVVARRW